MAPQADCGRDTYHSVLSKASKSFSLIAWVPFIASSECPSLPQVSVGTTAPPCLSTMVRSFRSSSQDTAWPADPRQSSWLLWVWMKPFHVRSRLSPFLVAPDDPLLPRHPDASGAPLSRLPSPAASSQLRDAANTTLLRSASEEAAGCSNGVAAGSNLLLSVRRICHKMGC